jgi:uncharacterized protein (TIGR03118 family)
MLPMHLRGLIVFVGVVLTLGQTARVWAAPGNAYQQTNLVANSALYAPQILDPTLLNAWGIAIRPAGFGGHFWVTSNGGGTSLEYVGDVGGVPLFQDDLKVVTVPGPSGSAGTPTGVVFNPASHFVVTQDHANGPITAPSRFLFVTDNGTLSAWTERKNPDGSFDRPSTSLIVVDHSASGGQFFGLGIDDQGGRLYVADFGTAPGLLVFDTAFDDISAGFDNPFQSGATLVPGEFTPFNVQTLTADGSTSVYVAYAKTQPDPNDPSAFLAGEEDAAPGRGRLAQFDVDGNLLAVWDDRGLLNAPWGLAIAPGDFGPFSNALLVSNFGDGTIVAFDRTTHTAIDYLRDPYGNPISIEGIWGLQFGNGASLGEANHLYFAAGPADETDGLFGKLQVTAPVPEPATWLLVLAGCGLLGLVRYHQAGSAASATAGPPQG